MHPSQWIGDAARTPTMIWERIFGDVADVSIVSPTSQSRLEKFNSDQLSSTQFNSVRLSSTQFNLVHLSSAFENVPMHCRHVHVDAGTSPSLTMMRKPGLRYAACFVYICFTCFMVYRSVASIAYEHSYHKHITSR